MNTLSIAARKLWAKKAGNAEPYYLPLITHLEDCAALAGFIWNRWLPEGTKCAICLGCGCDEERAQRLFVFLMAAHDVGKALPVFQSKTSGATPTDIDLRLYEELVCAGLAMKPYTQFSAPRRSLHALAGQIVLENAGCSRNVAAVVGAHHGRPPSADEAIDGEEDAQQSNFCVNKAGKPAWDAVRAQIVAYAMELSGYQTFEEMPTPDIAAQVLLSGLVIMTDWIASNEAYFTYISADEPVRVGIGRERARAAANKLDFLKTAWCPDCFSGGDAFFGKRFGFAPRAIQSAAMQTALSVAQPGIFIIEAPMGIGKTEAALVVAEIFAWAAGRSGVFFALPTQATSDGMFPRLLRWISTIDDPLHSVELVHGKAQFNDDFRALARIGGGKGIGQDDETGAAVYDWFDGRKKALLADFAVGTVDQLLQLALKQKHIMLRHLALSNKTVIIDECHAYDAYMNVYLKRALMWLGRYRVPVVMLSATLPREKRDELVRAYLGNDGKPRNTKPNIHGHTTNAYPLITYTDGDEILYSEIDAGADPLEIGISCIDDEDVVALLEGELAGGGCAGIIVNTVSRAQILADTLRGHFGEETVLLLHSRFTAGDRITRERELRAQLGKPGEDVVRPFRHIVVGTQVIEQSLDLDFDIMLSDLCPMDLLLQRLGRLHRHKRSRPAGLERARCFVLGANGDALDGGAAAVYGEYILMRTRALLPEQIAIPNDVCPLVQAAYDSALEPSCKMPDGYGAAKEKWKKNLSDKESHAKTYRIDPPWKGTDSTLEGWLNICLTDAAGEAAVRDTGDSLEVVAIKRTDDGGLALISTGQALPPGAIDDARARCIARESLRLPPALCKQYIIERTIAELERRTEADVPLWRQSPWLKDALVLVFDKNNETRLLEYRLKYDEFYGLKYEKEDAADAQKGIQPA